MWKTQTIKNYFRILVGKLFESQRRRWINKIMVGLEKFGYEGGKWS
jgi:hypothetical protein